MVLICYPHLVKQDNPPLFFAFFHLLHSELVTLIRAYLKLIEFQHATSMNVSKRLISYIFQSLASLCSYTRHLWSVMV